MSYVPDIVSALENLLERSAELNAARERVADAATPSYWIANEAEAFDRAKREFIAALNVHIDSRVGGKQ